MRFPPILPPLRFTIPRSSLLRPSSKFPALLVIAIILVAIVVFLFLGKLKTTLIPLLAVPVSIINAFRRDAVDRILANTVSLLALVLAIGIVVDDAIVVVEYRARDRGGAGPAGARGRKKAMAETTGPIVAIHFRSCRRCSFPWPLSPASAVNFSVNSAVAISVSMPISGAQCADLEVRRYAPCSLTHGQQSRGPMRYVLGAIDKARDGYVAVVRRFGARGGGRCRGGGWRAGGSAWSFSVTPQKVFCRTRIRARSSRRCGFRKAPR